MTADGCQSAGEDASEPPWRELVHWEGVIRHAHVCAHPGPEAVKTVARS